jgi:hypothetical protein
MRHSDSACQYLFSPLGEAVGRGGFYLFPFSKNFQIVPHSLKYLSPSVRISSGVARIRLFTECMIVEFGIKAP